MKSTKNKKKLRKVESIERIFNIYIKKNSYKSVNFLRKYFLKSCLKQFELVAVLRLLGSLFEVLGPTYDKLWFLNFTLQKGNFKFLLQEYVATPFLTTG